MTKRAKVLVAIAVLLAALNFVLFLSYPNASTNAPDIEKITAKAEKGDTHAQLQLYFAFKNGQLGVIPEPKTAIEWLRKAAEQNSSKAQNLLGIAYEKGTGVEQSYAEALAWYMKAANGGNAHGQGNVGRMFDLGLGVPRDARKAIEWYRKGAENGSAESQHNLGNSYLNGDGVERNDVEAFKWFGKAAERGFAPSQANLGLMYLDGIGTDRDLGKAAQLLTAAADGEISEARKTLEDARTICDGDGEPESKVYSCLLRAYASDTNAQVYIAYLHDKGLVLEKDDAKSAAWLKHAAFGGNVQAQMLLSIAYYKGDGVPKDLVESVAWKNIVEKSQVSDDATKEFLKARPQKLLNQKEQKRASERAAKYWESIQTHVNEGE